MPDAPAVVNGIALALTLDTSQFDAAVERSEARLNALRNGTGSGTISAPLRRGPGATGASAYLPNSGGLLGQQGGAVRAAFTVTPTLTAGSVRQFRSQLRQTLATDPVPVAVTLGRSRFAEMRNQISRSIGDVPIRITLQQTAAGRGTLDVVSAIVASAQGISKESALRQIRTSMARIGVAPTPVLTRASGGPVSSRRPTLVGENGPEILNTHWSGSIIPADEVMRIRRETRLLREERRRGEAEWVARMRLNMGVPKDFTDDILNPPKFGRPRKGIGGSIKKLLKAIPAQPDDYYDEEFAFGRLYSDAYDDLPRYSQKAVTRPGRMVVKRPKKGVGGAIKKFLRAIPVPPDDYYDPDFAIGRRYSASYDTDALRYSEKNVQPGRMVVKRPKKGVGGAIKKLLKAIPAQPDEYFDEEFAYGRLYSESYDDLPRYSKKSVTRPGRMVVKRPSKKGVGGAIKRALSPRDDYFDEEFAYGRLYSSAFEDLPRYSERHAKPGKLRVKPPLPPSGPNPIIQLLRAVPIPAEEPHWIDDPKWVAEQLSGKGPGRLERLINKIAIPRDAFYAKGGYAHRAMRQVVPAIVKELSAKYQVPEPSIEWVSSMHPEGQWRPMNRIKLTRFLPGTWAYAQETKREGRDPWAFFRDNPGIMSPEHTKGPTIAGVVTHEFGHHLMRGFVQTYPHIAAALHEAVLADNMIAPSSYATEGPDEAAAEYFLAVQRQPKKYWSAGTKVMAEAFAKMEKGQPKPKFDSTVVSKLRFIEMMDALREGKGVVLDKHGDGRMTPWNKRRWSGGRAEAWRQTIEQGGGTFDLKGHQPRTGYAVAVGNGEVIPDDDKLAFIRAFRAARKNVMAGLAPYVGTWHPEGRNAIYVDPATVTHTQRQAFGIGKSTIPPQEAIYDLKRHREIPVKAKGGLATSVVNKFPHNAFVLPDDPYFTSDDYKAVFGHLLIEGPGNIPFLRNEYQSRHPGMAGYFAKRKRRAAGGRASEPTRFPHGWHPIDEVPTEDMLAVFGHLLMQGPEGGWWRRDDYRSRHPQMQSYFAKRKRRGKGGSAFEEYFGKNNPYVSIDERFNRIKHGDISQQEALDYIKGAHAVADTLGIKSVIPGVGDKVGVSRSLPGVIQYLLRNEVLRPDRGATDEDIAAALAQLPKVMQEPGKSSRFEERKLLRESRPLASVWPNLMGGTPSGPWSDIQREDMRRGGRQFRDHRRFTPIKNREDIAKQLYEHTRPFSPTGAERQDRKVSDFPPDFFSRNAAGGMVKPISYGPGFAHREKGGLTEPEHWQELLAANFMGKMQDYIAGGVEPGLADLYARLEFAQRSRKNKELRIVSAKLRRRIEQSGIGLASGGEAEAGPYIVNENGRELFVPRRLQHLIPSSVMAQIPHKAKGGGVHEIDQQPWSLFYPPEDGWIIPNHLKNRVPRAAGGVRSGLGPDPSRKVVDDEAALLRAGRSSKALDALIGKVSRESGKVLYQTVQAGIEQGRVDSTANIQAAVSGRTVPSFLSGTFGGLFGRTGLIQAGTQLAIARKHLDEFTKANQRYLTLETQETVDKIVTANKAKLTELVASKNKLKADNVNLDRNSEAYQVYTKSLRSLTGKITAQGNAVKRAEAAQAKVAALQEEFGRRTEAVSKAERAASPSFFSRAGVFAGVLTGNIVSQLGFAAIDMVGSALKPTLVRAYEQATGYYAPEQRVTKGFADQMSQFGNRLSEQFSSKGFELGLGTGVTNFLEKSLSGSIIAKKAAGQQTEIEDLIRASLGSAIKTQNGLYGSYGGLFGGAFGAEALGGGRGVTELLAQEFGDYARAKFEATPRAGVSGQEAIDKYHNLRAARPSYTPSAEAIERNTIAQEAMTKRITDINATFASGQRALYQNTDGLKLVATTDQNLIKTTVDQGQKLADAIRPYSSSDADAIMAFVNNLAQNQTAIAGATTPEDIDKFIKGYAKGLTVLSSEQFLRMQATDRETARLQSQMQARLTREISIPFQFASQFAQNPYIPGQAGSGYEVGPAGFYGQGGKAFGAGIKADFAETQRLMDGLMAQTRDWIKTTTDFVSANVDQTAGAQFGQLMGEVQQFGTAVAADQVKIARTQAHLNFLQTANNLRLASRAVADALGVLGKPGGSKLGYIEREQTLLGFELQQRNINLQTAVAGYKVAGESPEERADRQAAALAEAKIAQKQLDLSRSAFQETSQRTLLDAQKSLGLFQEAQRAEATIAAANERIAINQQRGAIALAHANALFEEAAQNANTDLGLITGYVKQFGKEAARADGVLQIFSEDFDKLSIKIEELLGINRNPDRYPHAPGAGAATGVMFSTSGLTNLTVGEAGRETVAVLRNPRQMELGDLFGGGQGGGAGGITVVININGAVIREENDLTKLVQQVEDRLSNRLAMIRR